MIVTSLNPAIRQCLVALYDFPDLHTDQQSNASALSASQLHLLSVYRSTLPLISRDFSQSDESDLFAGVARLQDFFSADWHAMPVIRSARMHLLLELSVALLTHFAIRLEGAASFTHVQLSGWQQYLGRPLLMMLERSPRYWWGVLRHQHWPTKELTAHIDSLSSILKALVTALGSCLTVLELFNTTLRAAASPDFPGAARTASLVHAEFVEPRLAALVALASVVLGDCLRLLEPGTGPAARLAQAIGTYKTAESFPNLDPSSSVTYELFDSFRSHLSGFRSFFTNVRALLEPHHRPGEIRRRWFMYSVSALGIALAARTAFLNKDAIIHGVTSMHVTLENFFVRYLWNPTLDIYRTIRYDRTTFALMDPAALHSDEESLVRMVENFVKTHNLPLTPQQLQPLLDRAEHKGDLAVLMPTYEKEIQTPLKSALMGDLVQLLLIQVQKQRIDVERAMLALDKLMRANEFNFQALALLPAAAVTYLVLGGARRLLTQQALPLPTVTGFRSEMRNVSKLVIAAMTGPTAEMSLEDQGMLVLSLARMSVGLQVLPLATRKPFAQDLRLLAFHTPLVAQKQATIDRMYVSYPFLRT